MSKFLRVVDHRKDKVIKDLKDLKEGDVFEFVDHDGQGMGEPCRVCFRNSKYLRNRRTHMTDHIYIINMVRGTIHCRDPHTSVRPIYVEMVIQTPGVRSQL